MNFIKAFSTCLSASLLVLLIACKKDANLPDGALAYVPATATNIVAIDLKKLMQKADFKSLQQMDFYKKMISESEKENPQVTRVLLNPSASGIDLDAKIYAATAFDEQNPEEMTTYFFVPLKDAAAFGELWKNSQDDLSEENGIKILDSGSNAILGWSPSLAVFAYSNETSEAFVDRLVAVFTVDQENPLTRDTKLQKALSADHDITSWLSTNPMAKNAGAGFVLKMIDVEPAALRDNFISSYADFEDGKMVGHADFSINEQLGTGFIGRFFKKEASTDFSKILPKKAPSFASVMAFDLVGIDKFLSERPDTKKYADFYLNNFGFRRSDLLNALGGDVMVAGFDAKSMKEATLLVSFSLKNEAKARELLQAAAKANKLKEIEPGLYKVVSLGNEEFNIKVNKGMGKLLLKNGLLTFTSDDELMNQIKDGETSGEFASIFKSFDNQTLAGWFNLGDLQNMGNSAEAGSFKEMNFKVNAKGADFLLETNDPNTNSLKAFLEMVNEAYKKRGKMPEEAL